MYICEMVRSVCDLFASLHQITFLGIAARIWFSPKSIIRQCIVLRQTEGTRWLIQAGQLIGPSDSGRPRHLSHPQAIRSSCGEVALDQIRRWTCIAIADRGGHPLAPAHADQACRAHQPRHPLAPHLNALSFEFGVDAWRAVGTTRVLVNRSHPRLGSASARARADGGRWHHA
jgi:hypothetical protein